MPPYIYAFEQIHPEVFKRCLEYRHSVTFWHGNKIVGDADFHADSPGNVVLNLPSDIIEEFRQGTLTFTIREAFVNESDPTLVVRCLLSRTLSPK